MVLIITIHSASGPCTNNARLLNLKYCLFWILFLHMIPSGGIVLIKISIAQCTPENLRCIDSELAFLCLRITGGRIQLLLIHLSSQSTVFQIPNDSSNAAYNTIFCHATSYQKRCSPGTPLQISNPCLIVTYHWTFKPGLGNTYKIINLATQTTLCSCDPSLDAIYVARQGHPCTLDLVCVTMTKMSHCVSDLVGLVGHGPRRNRWLIYSEKPRIWYFRWHRWNIGRETVSVADFYMTHFSSGSSSHN